MKAKNVNSNNNHPFVGTVHVRGLNGSDTVNVDIAPTLQISPPANEFDNLFNGVIGLIVEGRKSGTKQSLEKQLDIDSGGASVGTNFWCAFYPGKDEFLLIGIDRVDDISAGTIAGNNIRDIPLELDKEFFEILKEKIKHLLKDKAKLLADRAVLRTGFNELIARNGLKESN